MRKSPCLEPSDIQLRNFVTINLFSEPQILTERPCIKLLNVGYLLFIWDCHDTPFDPACLSLVPSFARGIPANCETRKFIRKLYSWNSSLVVKDFAGNNVAEDQWFGFLPIVLNFLQHIQTLFQTEMMDPSHVAQASLIICHDSNRENRCMMPIQVDC